MTSDAKIGLLLGLIFIFIIAFVINGLPRFRSVSNGSEMTTNMVSSRNNTQPIGSRERQAQGVFDWTEQADQQTYYEPQPPAEPKEDVRFKIQLPKEITVAKETSIMEVAEQVEAIAQRPTETAPPVQEIPIEQEKAEAVKPSPAKSTKPAWPKAYVVSDGDTLADIAKMFYGPEEGNKRANVAKIFEANRNMLKTVDDIFVGQELKIPSLVTAQANTKETKKSIADTFFEKVKSIGRKCVTPRPVQVKKSKPYVVQEDDNLWRIASKELGNGSRYEEIKKLNANVIKNENDLTVGMLLRMPVQ